MDINTQDDWWVSLHTNLARFRETFFLIYGDTKRHDALVQASEAKDHETAHNILEEAWAAAPDSSKIHGWPGWGALCDLCSEYWVFQPE